MDEFLERTSVSYKNLSKKFSQIKTDYTRQYCSIYNVRLEQMREILPKRIEKKWGGKYIVCKLHKLAEINVDKCVVIGTLFKNQKLKPSVLKQLAESSQLVPQPIVTHFTDESDVLFIEDELQRYELKGEIKGDNLVTGITCALLGTDIGNGKFVVEDYTFAGYSEQIQRPLLENDTYILLVSGLDLIHLEKFQTNLQLFITWLSNLLEETFIDVSKVVRLIIAGNSVRTERENVAQNKLSLTSRVAQSNDSIEAVKLLDDYLLKFSQIIDVDVMPGEHDPSNHVLPQKQMHYCMFPKSSVYNTVNLVSNPYSFEIGGVKICGSSGQSVKDILRYSEVDSALNALENCLDWNHLAPTAPDTLGCYPFYESDPFIIEECPHVLFAGNTEKFDTKITKGEDGQEVRLICIPEFASSFQVCVLNLKNLDCFPITFAL